jgi:hypothetical protein
VEGPRRDEQDVVGAHGPVFGGDGRALDDGQDVALDAFPAHVRAMAALAPRDLVDLVDEEDARVLHPVHGRVRHLLRVHQPAQLFLDEGGARFGDAEPAPLGLVPEEAGQEVLDVDVHFLHTLRGEDLEAGEALLAHLDLHGARVEASGAQLAAQLLARGSGLLGGAGRVLDRRVSRGRGTGGGKEEIEKLLLDVRLRLPPHFRLLLAAHHVHRRLREVADHGLDVAAHVAHLGELRGLDLEEGAAAEAGQAARDLGLPHSRGPDHQDVLGCDLRRHLGRKALAADAVPQRDRDRLLGRGLAHHVAVELGHDLARR